MQKKKQKCLPLNLALGNPQDEEQDGQETISTPDVLLVDKSSGQDWCYPTASLEKGMLSLQKMIDSPFPPLHSLDVRWY